MKETSGQLQTLARATFAGFFESELLQPGLPQVRLVVFVIALLMFPATQVPLRAGLAYYAAAQRMPDVLDMLMWPHKLLFITLAMVGTAVVTLVIWDNVFPDRREAFIIGHLPIRTRTIVAARLVALAALMGLMALGSAAPSALLYGGVAGGYSSGGVARTVIAHFTATMGASMFAFLLLLSLQGALINLIPGRWLQRAMIVMQFFFVVVSLEALLFMHPIIDAIEHAMAPGSGRADWMLWTPPAWFLGLYEVIAGTSRPIGRLAVPAVVALALLLPGAFGLYAFTYQRLTRRAVEARDTERIGGGVGREPVAAWAASVLTRSAIGGGVGRFAVLTLLRGRKHRLLLTIFAGVGTTAAATGVLARLSRHGRLDAILAPEAILPIGLVFIYFLVVGVRTLFALPAEPAANWVFRLSDAEDARLHVRGGIAAMASVGVLPIVVLLLPLHLLALGLMGTAIHAAVMFAGGLLLAEITFGRFRRVPFTSAYAAPAARVRLMWPFWLAGFVLFSFTLSAFEARLLRRPIAAGALVAGIVAAAFAMRLIRERGLTATPRVLFEEDEEDALVTLQLGGVPPVPAPHTPN